MPARILVIDYNPYNLELLSALLEDEGYQPLGITTLEEFDLALASTLPIQLALVDLDGFDRAIWERCEKLRTRGIPLVVIATGASPDDRGEILQHGASGILDKPLLTTELIAMIGNLAGGKV